MSSRALLALAALACTPYDPPPDVSLEAPPGGTFVVGTPLRLTFSEPVDPSTLVVRIWPNVRDLEGELPPGTEPLLECPWVMAPCGTTELVADDDTLAASATIRLDRAGLGRPNVPLLLEVTSGLTDATGAKRDVPVWFAFQFKPLIGMNEDPVDFDNGIYLIVAEIDDPIPATLHLITDLVVIPDGRLALAGGKGKVVDGAPKNTHEISEVYIDPTANGFVAFTQGFVFLTEGERFLETEPLDLRVQNGNIVVAIKELRLTAKVVDEGGVDRLDGIMSFSELVLNPDFNGGYVYPAGQTSFDSLRIPDADVPEGAPRVCGDLCGAVISQCEPPDDFPDPTICQ
jgi:hypothetical protein